MGQALLRIPSLNYDLGVACKYGKLGEAKRLIEEGANSFNSGLVLACESGHLDIVQLMLEKGANDFNVGLPYACENGHLEIVKLLCKKGANEFNEGFQLACQNGHLEIVHLMLAKGANNLNDGLYTAFWFNRLNVAKFLIDVGINYMNPIPIRQDQYAELLNMGVCLDQCENAIKIKEYRKACIDEVKKSISQLDHPTWDYNIINPIICEYMPYEEKPTVIFGVKLW